MIYSWQSVLFFSSLLLPLPVFFEHFNTSVHSLCDQPASQLTNQPTSLATHPAAPSRARSGPLGGRTFQAQMSLSLPNSARFQ